MAQSIIDFLGTLNKTEAVPTFERNLDRLDIRYRWADSKAAKISGIISIVMGFGSLVPIFFFIYSILPIGSDSIVLLFLSPFFAFAGYYVYRGSATLLNHGNISIDGTELVSSDRPLPLTLTKKVSTSNIKRVYASYIVRSTKQGQYKIHTVRVVTNDGHDRIIDIGISETNAVLFAKEINKHLRLPEESFAPDLGTVNKEPGRLKIEYRSKDYTTSSNIGLLLFALLWTGFIVFFFAAVVLSSPIDLFVIVAMSPFTAIGVFLLYYSLGRVMNHSTILIDNGTLTTREQPLPFVRAKKMSLEDVQEFSITPSDNWSQPTNNRLFALTRNGKFIAIGRGLSQEQALMFAQEINDFLGVKPRVAT